MIKRNEGDPKQDRPTIEGGEGQEAPVVFESPEAAVAAMGEAHAVHAAEAKKAENESLGVDVGVKGAMLDTALDMNGPEVSRARWEAVVNARMTGIR